jgi:hypothetical protein
MSRLLILIDSRVFPPVFLILITTCLTPPHFFTVLYDAEKDVPEPDPGVLVVSGVGRGGGVRTGRLAVSPETVVLSPQTQQYVLGLEGLRIYHHALLEFRPKTSDVCPTSKKPSRLYPGPGPDRQFVSITAPMVGKRGVSVADGGKVMDGVSVNIGVSVSDGVSVAVSPIGVSVGVGEGVMFCSGGAFWVNCACSVSAAAV